MNFEAKYVIRWGIPGWVLIFWLLYGVVFIKGINPLDSGLIDITKGATLLISLAAIGVPIGYLMHQIYFGILWSLNKKRKYEDMISEIGENFPKGSNWGEDNIKNYFQLEYVWHSFLLSKVKESREYIEGRYRHMLGTIHGLGTLLVCSALSAIGFTIISIGTSIDLITNPFFWIGLTFQLAIFLSAVVNYNYFSHNLRAFQTKMLKEYFK
ncbi:hypothetical protein NCCP2716_13960 [Sporosarcina sp. NCCP-2716]|uniref:hypothetical protein n=1 Tax=Sporosarcina sp. NCCP-2716 TaxID=2943679 RepID=UPI00203CFD98|nr:hypothetical protein [Sporosarcina sp. NCCP-2716]GKV68898.1 hypothetical protein NCCP2716_13960 [Sporosarcina sp. NCCP-2716]